MPIERRTAVLALLILLAAAHTQAQSPTRPATTAAAPAHLAGRIVEEVRIIGRGRPLTSTLTSQIRHVVRSREGDRFDPATVEEDYQRIFDLRKFSNVESRVQPTDTGVIVIFEVAEQSEIREIRIQGNQHLDTAAILNVIDVSRGQAIEPFRLSLSREAIERLYREKNFPHAHVQIDQDALREGIVVFDIVEGPRLTVRGVEFSGNHTFSAWKLRSQVKTKRWFWIFNRGALDMDQLEQDVAALRQFYEQRGFFDARVGRTITYSADQSEAIVTFVIDEGRRYKVQKILFAGNASVPEAALRENLRLLEGSYYEADLVRRDVRELVRAYSPLGFIYQPPGSTANPDYLQIEPRTVFQREPGTVTLLYQIHEGKPFKLGRVMIKGNTRTQDKVILRELRVAPGELYNSAALQSASDRLRGSGLFSTVNMTPIGDDPDSRDLLVEVTEGQTGRFLVGAGITSNAGVVGSISYDQKNFDISNWPGSWDELASNRAFVGAGQYFRVMLEPGTELVRARVDWMEPWLFDQPYSLGTSVYIWDRQRDDYREARGGGRVSLGRRFRPYWSTKLTLRGEDVKIHDIDDKEDRAPEILEYEGHTTVTSAGIELKRDTTDSPYLPSRGTSSSVAAERVGSLGGDAFFWRYNGSFNAYHTLYRDLLDRKTILSLKLDAGYIDGDAPFFERYYGGGLGSVRGFRYRGISPRSGPDDDAVGGDFMAQGSAELTWPLISDLLRGAVWLDGGDVESDAQFGTIRVAAGFGFRLTLPVFGQLPVALDFGWPINKDDQDETRVFSFSLGIVQ